MSTPKSNRRHSATPRRTFGADDSALDDTDATPTRSSLRRALSRISLGSLRRPSFIFKNGSDSEGGVFSPSVERARIPSVSQPAPEAYATPLPVLSMIVLSITLLGEFLSANVSTPFLLFMVKGFGKLTDEAEIAFWTGILVATFFLTQFLTSLLWATVADRHGRRSVLIVSLLGSAVTCAFFGTSTSLPQAICIRLLQGIFAGAVGVARGSVAFVTDASNEGRAYAILGFCWGFGGVAGAIIGGTFESPAEKWPGVFAKVPLFVEYPYLLPCALAAFVTLLGSFLACFLGPDGGPRQGAIQLPPEKVDTHPTIPEEDEESIPPSPIFDDEEPRDTFTGSLKRSIGRTIGKRLSGYFASRVPVASSAVETPLPQPPVPLSTGARLERTRTVSNSKPSRFNGSAYGYSSYRNRLASNATLTRRFSTRRGSTASYGRRGSNADGLPNRESFASDMNFAQRLLMANENAVTNIADLWVAAAMNVDNEDPFESDSENGSEVGDNDSDVEDPLGEFASEEVSTSPTTARPRRSSRTSFSGSSLRPPVGSSRQHPFGSPRRPSIPTRPIAIRQPSSAGSVEYGTPTSRRFSNVPSIFSHPGVRTPSAVLDAQQLLLRDEGSTSASDPNEMNPNLEPILESRRASAIVQHEEEEEVFTEKAPSLVSQIPILVIIQYGLLALHSTTHDQVFMSYLVTDYDSGGLNLNAGHFAQLIALMCLAQIFYQFYLYPNLGPPRGRFSHMTMFRLGSLFFIPSYLSVILYRVPFASEEEDGNLPLMAALTLSTALRFCGSTFGYTAISILLNYMTPPDAVGLANGIAQSIVSLARCIGPVMGGLLWSVSIEGNPNGYPLGFIVCAGVCAVAVLHSFFIR
ncbi:hypothetical protein GYMLUDRAFT_46768 [Collybiopsis luxurians FD-317 M1]|uniref:Major facilitator superfamily MFS-1 n=1 Tax=Collybiopsis luxurians FD-317 M1 TaxID=944289 RepID=A0A0D0C3C6_9AGAR|nr:hypothetical protein GYMLUDRAFT_46768 [Collybiopsis luxurians FD-317 M1]